MTYTIPDQDNLSKKKDRIAKIELFASILCFAALLVGLWLYNAQHALIEFEFKSETNLTLPALTLCVPGFVSLESSQHVFIFTQFNLTNVTRPGQLVNQNVIEHCSSRNDRQGKKNTCLEFIEYDGLCVHVGLNNAFPWSLQTEGKTLLSVILVYRSDLESTRRLVLPFFGWNSTCHGAQDDPSCTLVDDQNLGVQSLQRNSPFILYQLAPDQMLLADIKEEHHITAHGVKSTIYPTTFVGFPIHVPRDFGSFCSSIEPETSEPCRVIYLGIRSLTRVVQNTREENYLSRVIRSIAMATSQLSLIMGAAAILFGYFVTRLAIKKPSGYIDHDLREAVLFLINEAQNKQQNLI